MAEQLTRKTESTAEVESIGGPAGSRVQLKRALAGLSYADQVEAVRPPPADEAAPVQMSNGNQPPSNIPAGTTDLNAIRTQQHIVVGNPLPDRERGRQVMRRLAQGDTTALAPVGVAQIGGAFVEGSQQRAINEIEWGLAGFPDGRCVIIRGAAGVVLWHAVPDAEPLAHSHPTHDADQKVKELDVSNGATIDAILGHTAIGNWVNLLPSSGDIGFCNDRNLTGHTVHTPYRYHPPTRTIDSGFDRNLPTIDCVIDSTYRASDGALRARVRIVSGGVLWEGELQAGSGFSFPVGAL